MNDADRPHCLPNDADLFAAADDVAEFAIEHAAELTARDRAHLANPARDAAISTEARRDESLEWAKPRETVREIINAELPPRKQMEHAR
jgi:hypothetical protein